MMTAQRACRHSTVPAHAALCHAVMRVEAMPKRLRRRVEDLMVVCLSSEQPMSGTPDDWMSAELFTQWRRSLHQLGSVDCTQHLAAPRRELERLHRHLRQLAAEHGFSAELSYR